MNTRPLRRVAVGDEFMVSRDVRPGGMFEFQVWVVEDGTGSIVWDRTNFGDTPSRWRRLGAARRADAPDEELAAVFVEEQQLAVRLIAQVFPITAQSPAENGAIRMPCPALQPLLNHRARLVAALAALDRRIDAVSDDEEATFRRAFEEEDLTP